MDISRLSLPAALAMLVFGVLLQAALRKLFYPWMRWRYEAAKARGQAGVEPNAVIGVLQLLKFLALPSLGFVFGDQVLRALLQ